MVRLVTESVHNGRAVEAESIPSPSFPHDFPFPKQQTSDTMQSTTVGQPKRKTALPQEYSAQIHDWDLTLAAAAELTKAGLAADSRPTTGTLPRGFPFFTGGMVLSFAALECYSASAAFAMQSDHRFPASAFPQYRKTQRSWDNAVTLRPPP